MNRRAPNWHSDVGRAIGVGIHGVECTVAKVGQTLHVPCAHGHTADFFIATRMPPEQVAKKMMQAGWTIGRKPICPEHSRKEKIKPQAKGGKARSEKLSPERRSEIARHAADVRWHNKENESVAAQPANDTTPRPSVNGVQARRATIEWLMEAFDADKGCYTPGVSDATIAKETGLAEAAVATIREENFGPLREPPEIEQARAELNRLEERITQHEKETAATVAKWREDVSAHRHRLGALIAKNGWKQP